MLYTGLRAGEVRGLRWEDFDADAATLHVQRQLHAVTHHQRFAPPKDGEDRVIQLAPEAVDVLKRQRVRQAEQRMAAGADWREDDISAGLIFRQRKGQPHSEVSIYKAVRAAGAAIGVPGLRPHDLRHSYAVAALRSGVDVKTVQHNLGHRNASITLDTYAAYTTDAGKEGARKLSEYLQNAQK
jgi:integrase